MSQILTPQMITFLVAMLPIAELRGAIPLALGVYHLPPVTAFIFAVLGNMASVVLLLWLMEPVAKFLSRHFSFCQRFFNWLFTRTRKKHSRHFAIWGSLALIAFVAVPLPMTGGWTGSVAAFVFGIKFKKSLPLIGLGVCIAGLIVTFVSLGVLAL